MLMHCDRCNGEMYLDTYVDLQDDTGHFSFHAWRCLNCGYVYDPVIAANKKLHPAPMVGKNRKQVVGIN